MITLNLGFLVFLGFVALVWGFLIWDWMRWRIVDLAEERAEKLAKAKDDREIHTRAQEMFQAWWTGHMTKLVRDWNETFHWVVRANQRRKRVERALRRERAKFEKLTQQHESLAADVTDQLLTMRDRQAVTKGLTRKL